MPWGNRSKERLKEAHPELYLVADRALLIAQSVGLDLTIGEVHREEAAQEAKFNLNLTEVHYPDSYHNSWPSEAIHILPYPTSWPIEGGPNFSKDLARFYVVGTIVLLATEQLIEEGLIKCWTRWGGDWDSDSVWTDQTFDDLGHFERRTDARPEQLG